jgi:hypothetical protein
MPDASRLPRHMMRAKNLFVVAPDLRPSAQLEICRRPLPFVHLGFTAGSEPMPPNPSPRQSRSPDRDFDL